MADVLLIEDDFHQRAWAAKVLASAGHRIREAADGEAGLREAVAQPPEVIVCDVLMPGLNGYQFVAALREQPRIRGTPVILLTSLAEREQVRVGMNAGADDYLAKPLRPEELREAVDALLRRKKVQQQAMAASAREDLEGALARQRELLASRYETQLVRALDERWRSRLQAGTEATYPGACLLLADLFAALDHAAARHPKAVEIVKRAHEAARDALYLFGATHLLHHGGDLVGVFTAPQGDPPPVAAALRSAFALQAALAPVFGSTGLPVVTAVETGPFTLVRLEDPLHGDAGYAAVPGPTLQRAQAIRALARQRAAAVMASEAVLALLPTRADPAIVSGDPVLVAGTRACALRRG